LVTYSRRVKLLIVGVRTIEWQPWNWKDPDKDSSLSCLYKLEAVWNSTYPGSLGILREMTRR
jgi:hypothetical protein